MKKTTNAIVIALTAMILLTAPTLQAAPIDSLIPVELKMSGKINNQPLVQLNFSAAKNDNEFTITISDEAGLVLYASNVKGESFSRSFLLNTDELGAQNVNFEITSRKTGRSVNYKVSQTQSTSDQTNIVKL